MITISLEAIFDLIQSNKAKFRNNYTDYNIEISDSNNISEDTEEPINIYITKESTISLLLNRNMRIDYTDLKIETW